ncbi:MAG: sn-glycerol-3-phosphate ABC transporter ATP-binding protein UgpC [Rhodobacteraceae bacterium]|nr:sn-glycerol-3-phosphate ABC transporter ATP-binding protein UgpC [Paracoccaceae bacterium]
MAQIILDRVGKSYGKVSVLDDISMTIGDGEFVVLVGPSGCGKSTLLRMIAGLEDITAGEIMIGDKVANRIPAKQRDLAMVFQSYALYPHMNVADNMSFALKLARVSKSEIKARVDNAAEILGLSDLLDRVPRELSGGQRQRVAMGRAIVRDPIAFLFDEPLSNLDAKLRVKMRSEIKKLHKRLGKTMVYVTHDQTEAMTMADTIVVLNDGGIAQMGHPLDLYRDPDSAFVASFIGSPETNLMSAKVAAAGAAHVILSDGTKMLLKSPLDMTEGTDITYGIRPQHIAVVENGISGEVLVVEPTGEDQNLVVHISGQDISVVAHGPHVFSVGEKLKLQIDIDKVLLFNAETGLRIR